MSLEAMAEFDVDRLAVRVYRDRGDLGAAAARMAAGKMAALLAEKPAVSMIFAAAPSQNEFLARLGACQGLDWGRVVAFQMDEYLGLAGNAPQSFGRFLRERLFDKVKPGQVHYLRGDTADPAAECRRYAGLLETYPADIVCLGIGENGHLAFNDPPANFDDPLPVKIVELEERCRAQQVHDGCFSKLADVPVRAMTLTIPTLMRARWIYGMVPGRAKAEAVRRTLCGPVGGDCPASILRRHERAVLFLDRDSAGLLEILLS